MVISSKALPLEALFSKGRFEPAVAQRAYEWDEPQWRDLLRDLTNSFAAAGLDPGPSKKEPEIVEPSSSADDATDIGDDQQPTPKPMSVAPLQGSPPDSYFLGQMVLWPRRGEASFYIYDGQQRLTTLTLLLCAMRDGQSEIAAWQPLQEMLRTSEKLARLTLGTGSRLASIVDGLGETAYPKNYKALSPENKRLYRAANYFSQHLKAWEPARIQAFVKFVRERVIIVATEITDRRLAQTAYVTLNTRGLPLSSSDILKGHLAQFVAQYSLVQSNEVVARWDALANSAKGDLEAFLKAADFHWFGRYRASDFGLEIMEQFRDEADVGLAMTWVSEELPRLHAIYKEIHEYRTMPEFAGAPLRFRRLSFLPWQHWVPFAMVVLEKYSKTSKSRAPALRELERWCFVVNLLGWDDETIADRIAKGIAQLRDRQNPFLGGREMFVTSTQRKQAMRRLEDGQFDDRHRRRAHVRWLETQLWDGERVPERAVQREVTVEHVLPRRASGQWEVDFPNNLAIYAEKIGNLCLVPRDELKAEQFAVKRPAYLAFDPQHRSVHDVAKYETWNAAAVDDRTEKLRLIAANALRLA